MLTIVPSRRVAAQFGDASRGKRAGRFNSRTVFMRRFVTVPDILSGGYRALPSPQPWLARSALELVVIGLIERLEPAVRERFGPGIMGPGAAAVLSAAIFELRRAGISSADLVEPTQERRRLQCLAAVLHEYETTLDRRGWWDDADVLRAVTEAIAGGAWTPPGSREILVSGLYKLTTTEERLLVALARSADRTRIEVPFDPHNETAYRYAFPFLKLWESLDDPGLDIDVRFVDPPADSLRAALVANYRQENPDHEIDGDSVSLVVAQNPTDEIRRVADWILQRAGEMCPLEQMGIVLANDHYVSRLGAELERRGIACHARRAGALAETPFFGSLLMPFRLLENGFRRADLLAWVSSPLTTELDPNLLRGALVRGPAGRTTVAAWKRVLTGVKGPPAAALVGCLNLLESLGIEETTPADFWRTFEDALEKVGLTAGKPTLTSQWENWERVRSELQKNLAALELWEGTRRGWRTHRRHLTSVLSGQHDVVGRAGRGVGIYRPYDARGLRLQHVAIVGLVQGALVRPRRSEAILDDGCRRLINDHFGELRLRTTGDENHEAPLLFLERLRLTAGDVLLTHPAEDDSGNPVLPALVFEEARRALGRSFPEIPEHPSGTTWRTEVEADEVVHRQRLERERIAFFQRDPSQRRGSGGRFDGVFPPDVANTVAKDALDGNLARWSTGPLEAWRSCPFKFLMGNLLKLRTADEQPIEAEPTVQGSLAHAALERLYGAGLGTGIPTLHQVQAAVADAADSLTTAERGDPAVFRLLEQRVAVHLMRYFKFLQEGGHGSYEPLENEIGFGTRNAEINAVEVATRFGPAQLVGRIDRIDRLEEGGELRVVDYKYSRTGQHKESVDPEECGVNRFQLYAYFLGAGEWALQREEPARTFYGSIHCLKEPSILGPLTSPPLADVRSRISETIEAALTGPYDPSPRSSDTCRYCDFRFACRVQTVPGAALDLNPALEACE